MSRREEPRENLLAEATAMTRRVEVQLPDQPHTVFAGFRRSGAASFFFGELVLQFNSAGQFRRGYYRSRLIKAERGHLIALRRQRETHQTQLLRRELEPTERANGACSLSDQHVEVSRATFFVPSTNTAAGPGT